MIKTKLIRGINDAENKSTTFTDRLDKALVCINTEELIDIKYSTIQHPELEDEILFTALIIYHNTAFGKKN